MAAAVRPVHWAQLDRCRSWAHRPPTCSSELRAKTRTNTQHKGLARGFGVHCSAQQPYRCRFPSWPPANRHTARTSVSALKAQGWEGVEEYRRRVSTAAATARERRGCDRIDRRRRCRRLHLYTATHGIRRGGQHVLDGTACSIGLTRDSRFFPCGYTHHTQEHRKARLCGLATIRVLRSCERT
jgi:hypothetical protein